jgi:lactate dehydrogenase-like 2-hydroxyacid dehydrogenase
LRAPSHALPAPARMIDPTVKQRFMKFAFRHSQSAYATQLFQGLSTALIGHELLSWPSENPAPANDIRVLLALGPLGRAQLEPLLELELVQTVSAGFESVDVDAASEMGIWVSNAPAGLTGNAASVAEFAMMLLIGASRHLGAALRSETDEGATAFTTNQALMGKTTCIVGLGSIGQHLV